VQITRKGVKIFLTRSVQLRLFRKKIDYFSSFTSSFSSRDLTDPYSPTLVQIVQVLENFGVCKVIASGHQDFKVGDLVWGMTGWEEYTLIHNPESFFKINHPELPLSYYTGVLGEFIV
jgi:NADPH-dependent curcumin reductase CurA